jgi:hypothetical protein
MTHVLAARTLSGFGTNYIVGLSLTKVVCGVMFREPKAIRPTLGGRRGCFIRADCIENLNCSSLNVFEALAEELRVTTIQADVVLRGAPSFETDCTAHDKRDGLSLSFADALRCAAPAFAAVHEFVRHFMR